MTTLKLVQWNMEWLNDLFEKGDGAAQFRADDVAPQHAKSTTVKKRREELADVIKQLDPDIVVVVEGPSRREELALFFEKDIAGTWAVELQTSSGGMQNLGIAVRTDRGKFEKQALKMWDTAKDSTFDPFLIDTDNDEVQEQYRFERRPLYVEIYPVDGKPFRIFGLHLKSKGIFKSYEWSKWWSMADANAKRILAQASRVRNSFLDPYLSDEKTKNIPLIVCGDINDGPGLDASEKKLFGSGVEKLMGNVWKPELCLGNALYDTLPAHNKSSLDFSDTYTTSFRDPIFNDTYQNEWIDHILYSRNRDGWVVNGKINETLPDGNKIWKSHKHASDHFPVSVEIRL